MTNFIEQLEKSLIEKRKKITERRKSIRANAAKLKVFFGEVDALGGDAHTDGDWVFVTVTGDKHKFLAFARLLRKYGFELPKIEKGATGFTKFTTMDDLPLYFQFSSTQCRRVKVGTKMVEQEVFEVVCDEIEPYEPAQPAPVAAQSMDDIPF